MRQKGRMVNPDTLIITMTDCQKAGHCAPGVRRWFHTYDLDFRAFMKDGISAKGMLATGDGQGRQVVARTIKRRLLENGEMSDDEAIAMLEAGI